MDPVYVFGHKNPDTDSIVAAIAYASLRNALGDRQYVACRLGVLSDETSRILQRFGFESPMRLHDVRTQVKDLSFDRPPILSDAVTVHKAWELMNESDLPSASLPPPGTSPSTTCGSWRRRCSATCPSSTSSPAWTGRSGGTTGT